MDILKSCDARCTWREQFVYYLYCGISSCLVDSTCIFVFVSVLDTFWVFYLHARNSCIAWNYINEPGGYHKDNILNVHGQT